MVPKVSLKNNINIIHLSFKCYQQFAYIVCVHRALKTSTVNISPIYQEGENLLRLNTAVVGQMKIVQGSDSIYLLNFLYK